MSHAGVSGTVRGRGCFLVPGPSRWGGGKGQFPRGPSAGGLQPSRTARDHHGPSQTAPQVHVAHVLALGRPLTGPRGAPLLALPGCRVGRRSGPHGRAGPQHRAPFSHDISMETPPPFPKNKVLSLSRNSAQCLTRERGTERYFMIDSLGSLQLGSCVQNKAGKRRERGCL